VAVHGGGLRGLRFDIGQQSGAHFVGPGFRLAQVLVGKLDIGIAFRRQRQRDGAL
jgi:hypothetical protein